MIKWEICTGCCLVGARLLLQQDRAVDPNYLEKKQVASILMERAAHLWEWLHEAWTCWKLKILAASSATPQPASTYDINLKNRRWFSWTSDFDLEVNVTGIQTTWRFLADTQVVWISKSYVASFISYHINNLGLPHCQPSRVTTIHHQPFTSEG